MSRVQFLVSCDYCLVCIYIIEVSPSPRRGHAIEINKTSAIIPSAWGRCRRQSQQPPAVRRRAERGRPRVELRRKKGSRPFGQLRLLLRQRNEKQMIAIARERGRERWKREKEKESSKRLSLPLGSDSQFTSLTNTMEAARWASTCAFLPAA